eukprot:COSAG05_NODE_795_length_7281_cov_33.551100_7_plen_87_part_00
MHAKSTDPLPAELRNAQQTVQPVGRRSVICSTYNRAMHPSTQVPPIYTGRSLAIYMAGASSSTGTDTYHLYMVGASSTVKVQNRSR